MEDELKQLKEEILEKDDVIIDLTDNLAEIGR
jgi:hypothetical protein